MDHPDVENDWLLLEGVKQFEDDDILLDVLSNIRRMEEPDYFERESVNLSVDDREEIGITLRGDNERYVYLHLGDEEGELHVHTIVDKENLTPYQFVLEKILEEVGTLEISEIQSHYLVDIGFTDAAFYPSLPEQPDIIGLRIDLDDGNVLVQEGDDKSHVLYIRENCAGLEGLIPENYFETELAEIQEFISREFL